MMEYTEEELEALDRISIDGLELSARTYSCLKNEALLELKVEPTVGAFARLGPARRLLITNYGRKSEREFAGEVARLVRLRREADAPPARRLDAPPCEALAEQLFRDFLSNPIYNNMPFEDIARQARHAAGAFRKVSERGVYGP